MKLDPIVNRRAVSSIKAILPILEDIRMLRNSEIRILETFIADATELGPQGFVRISLEKPGFVNAGGTKEWYPPKIAFEVDTASALIPSGYSWKVSYDGGTRSYTAAIWSSADPKVFEARSSVSGSALLAAALKLQVYVQQGEEI